VPQCTLLNLGFSTQLTDCLQEDFFFLLVFFVPPVLRCGFAWFDLVRLQSHTSLLKASHLFTCESF
jgi:hypothetical protein